MENKTKYTIILTIFLISLIFSGILTFVSLEEACGGIQTTCYAVQTSQYESTFGIKNSNIGLVAFSIMAILVFLHIKQPTKYKKQMIVAGIIGGTIFALYFLYIQFFVIDALCKYCMVIDIGMLLNLGIIIFWKDK
ncbi:MAG TPA: vitamin K epoxide reductase family protein [Candidatus Pacearchaeota archaeon]|nr:vitamin K epoxide reductase family protein [Candidatus Pacearchaeota archaeon]HOR52391.1 vitamin K epoxide reductase family protein [Candidatus Pacearchaeota archaeon]HOU78916.1 vitamin K epoxide reductase family protein [Candidatus Pacearchaeota archaeon]HPJ86487.1 vitamin K epoxide reductase family protein [Candidatus Pacearchaeota archaeon]HQF82652.1 vitamin K epoxide reductase family protein [Candidatus Pacearchaeota archaeon]